MLMDLKPVKDYRILNHTRKNKKILLFVREKAKDENGNTMGYVFIGEGNFKEQKVQNQ